jgi:hypothetical protein
MLFKTTAVVTLLALPIALVQPPQSGQTCCEKGNPPKCYQCLRHDSIPPITYTQQRYSMKCEKEPGWTYCYTIKHKTYPRPTGPRELPKRIKPQ